MARTFCKSASVAQKLQCSHGNNLELPERVEVAERASAQKGLPLLCTSLPQALTSLGNMQLPTPDARLALIQADLPPQPASIRSQELLSRSPHCDTTGLVLVALPTEQAAPASLLARREQAAFDSLCELVLNPNGTHFLL